ncbi:hypothetical protein [Caenimonas koreensis]|nr:hypothetical protein [Caenimonas koreensis]
MPDSDKLSPLRSLQILGVLSIAVPLFLYVLFAVFRLNEFNQVAE